MMSLDFDSLQRIYVVFCAADFVKIAACMFGWDELRVHQLLQEFKEYIEGY
jgi:hypothetical protein